MSKKELIRNVIAILCVITGLVMCAVLPFIIKNNIDKKNEKKHIHRQTSSASGELIEYEEQFSYYANPRLNVVATVTTDTINYNDIKDKIVYIQTKVQLTKEELKEDEYCEYAVENFRVDMNNTNMVKVVETEPDGVTPLKVAITFDVKAVKGKNIDFCVYAFTEDEFDKELKQETNFIKSNGVYSNTQDKDKIQFAEGSQRILCNTVIAEGTELPSSEENAAFVKVLLKLDEHGLEFDGERNNKHKLEPKFKSTEFEYEINGVRNTTLVDIVNNDEDDSYWQVIGELYANIGEEIIYTTIFPSIGDVSEIEEKGMYKVALE